MEKEKKPSFDQKMRTAFQTSAQKLCSVLPALLSFWRTYLKPAGNYRADKEALVVSVGEFRSLFLAGVLSIICIPWIPTAILVHGPGFVSLFLPIYTSLLFLLTGIALYWSIHDLSLRFRLCYFGFPLVLIIGGIFGFAWLLTTKQAPCPPPHMSKEELIHLLNTTANFTLANPGPCAFEIHFTDCIFPFVVVAVLTTIIISLSPTFLDFQKVSDAGNFCLHAEESWKKKVRDAVASQPLLARFDFHLITQELKNRNAARLSSEQKSALLNALGFPKSGDNHVDI